MPDDFVDPINDPRFPNRPTTEAFWKLCDVILQCEGMFEDDPANDSIFEDLINGVGVDMETLSYVANQRTLRLLTFRGDNLRDSDKRQIGMALWMDAFVHGYKYRQKLETETPPSE